MSDNPFKNHSVEAMEQCIREALEALFKDKKVSVTIDRLSLSEDGLRATCLEMRAWSKDRPD